MKYAIVTGGTYGLGPGIVRALFEYGVVDAVAVVSRKPAPPTGLDGRVHGFLADVTDEAQVREAVEAAAARFGPNPLVLCNNAGGGEKAWFDRRPQGTWETTDLFRRYVELNLNSVHIVTEIVVPRMLAGASICNVTSVAGQIANPVMPSYAAAKAGVDSYTRSCALAFAPQGIRVNAVAPGLIYTPLWADLGSALGGAEENSRATFDAVVADLTPMGREQSVEDIGRAVAWLCSEHARNVTGQILAVDGGITLGANPLRSLRSPAGQTSP
jgi:NAD(P)-dependent dehydrogenase (short-subunit alcohol dehydrogenase family)